MRQVAPAPGFDTVEDAIAAIAAGRMVVVVDSPQRENEGDLVMAAELVTPEAVNFMATHGRGLICAALTEERLAELGIPPMVSESTDRHGTAFHVSVDHRVKATTGISAADRAHTIAALASPDATGADFARPGHVFPLAARPGGVLHRRGHTEASVDLSRLAGCAAAGVLCEIAAADGQMARLPRLREFAREHSIPLISIADLIAYRRQEQLVDRVSEAALPTAAGVFTAIGYRDRVEDSDHIALVMGDVQSPVGVLASVHERCIAGDVFRSRRCDCGPRLEGALERIASEGRGVIVYLRSQERRGVDLLSELTVHRRRSARGLDVIDGALHPGPPGSHRDVRVAALILRDLGVDHVRLLTGDAAERLAMEQEGLTIAELVALDAVAEQAQVTPLEARRRRLRPVPRSRRGDEFGAGDFDFAGG